MDDDVDDPPWLTPDQLDAWMTVLALAHALPAALDAQLKREAGINNSYEYYVLASLSEAPDHTLRMSTLAQLAQGSLSRLSHAVHRLERAGWVQRHPSPDGARYTDAQLTPAGWDKVREIAPGHVREARRLVVDALTAEQLEQLRRAARIVVERAAPATALLLDTGL